MRFSEKLSLRSYHMLEDILNVSKLESVLAEQ